VTRSVFLVEQTTILGISDHFLLAANLETLIELGIQLVLLHAHEIKRQIAIDNNFRFFTINTLTDVICSLRESSDVMSLYNYSVSFAPETFEQST
jgi:hypothetical protein